MADRDAAIRKATAALIRKADDCIELAKAELAGADEHHELAAHQEDRAATLTKLGNELQDDAVLLTGELAVNPDVPRK